MKKVGSWQGGVGSRSWQGQLAVGSRLTVNLCGNLREKDARKKEWEKGGVGATSALATAAKGRGERRTNRWLFRYFVISLFRRIDMDVN